jgi:hypothetical protein
MKCEREHVEGQLCGQCGRLRAFGVYVVYRDEKDGWRVFAGDPNLAIGFHYTSQEDAEINARAAWAALKVQRFEDAVRKSIKDGMSWGQAAVEFIKLWREAEPDRAQMLGPKFSSRAGVVRQSSMFARLMQAAVDDSAMDSLGDAEIADLVQAVWGEQDCLSPPAALLAQCVSRLRRAGGGPDNTE